MIKTIMKKLPPSLRPMGNLLRILSIQIILHEMLMPAENRDIDDSTTT
jgi:hypothetical protein